MGEKFAIFFLVGVCLIQAYQCHIVQPRGIVDDIADSINKMIGQIEDKIVDTTSEITDSIINIEDTLNNIFKEVNLDEVKQVIENNINKAVDEVIAKPGLDPDTVKVCLDVNSGVVKQFLHDTSKALDSCRESAENHVHELTKDLHELTGRAHTLFEDSAETVKKCIKDNGINIIGAASCLKKHLSQLTSDATALTEQFHEVLIAAEKAKTTIPADTMTCLYNKGVEVEKGQTEIINNLKKCVGA